MTIERHSADWYAALDAFVCARAAMPFVWGGNDCCTFAADWVMIARGADPMADLRKGLDSKRKAHRALNAAGGILAAVVERMGESLAGPMAQVGDVALVRHGDGLLSMAVCLGSRVASPGVAGLLMVPITQAEAAWRV